jgi:hypothetical protein
MRMRLAVKPGSLFRLCHQIKGRPLSTALNMIMYSIQNSMFLIMAVVALKA